MVLTTRHADTLVPHSPGTTSTIDLTLTGSAEKILGCNICHGNHGSDHRGTYSEWSIQPELRLEQQLREAHERTNWEKVGKWSE
jgi:cytochrome c553